MVVDADRIGGPSTSQEDPRLPARSLSAIQLDELPQLINVFLGSDEFRGPRPEVRSM